MAYEFLGRIVQIAYVVDDLDRGIEHWTDTMNVGPFGRFTDVRMLQSEYRGQNRILQFEAAIAYSGELMVELIRPLGPSIFLEHLHSGQTGIHHMAYATDNFRAAKAELASRGARLVQGGMFADGSENAYFEIPGSGAYLEVGELSPQLLDLFARLKAAADSWTGSPRTIELHK